jgi:hypothetical protein
VKCVEPGQEQPEAGPSRKRKKTDKGKGRRRRWSPSRSSGFREMVQELRLLRRELREVRIEFRSTHCIGVELTNKLADVARNVEDLAFFLTPNAEEKLEENEGVGSSGGARGSGEAPEGAPEEVPEDETLQ